MDSATAFWVAVAVVVVTSSARLTRLITFDDFPPIKWVRDAFVGWTDRHARLTPWQTVAYCGYCASFWITLAVVGWGYLTDWQTAWWIVNGVLGASYLAAILMANDGEGDD